MCTYWSDYITKKLQLLVHSTLSTLFSLLVHKHAGNQYEASYMYFASQDVLQGTNKSEKKKDEVKKLDKEKKRLSKVSLTLCKPSQ